MPDAIRLYARPAEDGATLLCALQAGGMQVISKHRIENPTPEQLQAMAHQEYPHIPAADWYVVDDPTRRRFEIIYISATSAKEPDTMANKMTTGQYAEMHDRRRECGITEEELTKMWLSRGMPRTFHSAARMITILTIRATFKRMGYDTAQQNTVLDECLGAVKPVELLTTEQIKTLHKRVKMLEGRMADRATAPFVVATFKVDTTTVHTDQLAALKHCDHYDAPEVLKILFVDGKPMRFSAGGVVFEPVDFQGARRKAMSPPQRT